jgi:hypothetical protein
MAVGEVESISCNIAGIQEQTIPIIEEFVLLGILLATIPIDNFKWS